MSQKELSFLKPGRKGQRTYKSTSSLNSKKNESSDSSNKASLSFRNQDQESSDEESSDSQSTLETSPVNPALTAQFKHIRDCKKSLCKIMKELTEASPTNIKTNCKKIATYLTNISDWATQQQQTIELQNATIVQLKNQLDNNQKNMERVLESLPQPDTFENLVRECCERLNPQEQRLPQPETLVETIEATVKDSCERYMRQQEPQAPTSPSSSQQQPTATASTSQQQVRIPNPQNKLDQNAPVIRRSLRIKSRKGEHGMQVWETLNKAKLVVPAGIIKKVTLIRNGVDIICRTIAERDLLRREYHRQQNILMNFDITNKPEKIERIIVTGTPTGITKEEITQALIEIFSIPEDLIKVHFSLKTRQGTTNWILGTPIDIAAELIEATGIYLGTQQLNIRPYVAVQRCRRCQALGHSEKFCNLPFHCVNCGEAHDDSHSCQKSPRCRNCSHYNRVFNKREPTNHPASDSQCQAYRFEFDEEKSRLERMYFEFLNPHRNDETLFNQANFPPPFYSQEVPPRFRHQQHLWTDIPHWQSSGLLGPRPRYMDR